MARIAFTTFAIMKAAYGSPQVHGFERLTPAVFRQAEAAPGFIDRAREIDNNEHLTNFERDWGEWGPFAVPHFYDGGRDTANDTRASTVSIWSSLQSVQSFAYSGLHQRALRQRSKWFRTPEWPTYAIWWISDDHIPTWREAVARLEHLHQYGASFFAFDFTCPFGEDGTKLPSTEMTTVETGSAHR